MTEPCSAAPSAVELARESPFTVEEWAWALNTLGKRTDLLPLVKDYVARHAVRPYSAACIFLGALDV